jgi:hypothetical protein
MARKEGVKMLGPASWALDALSFLSGFGASVKRYGDAVVFLQKDLR